MDQQFAHSWKSIQSGQTYVDLKCLFYITNNYANKYLVKGTKLNNYTKFRCIS